MSSGGLFKQIRILILLVVLFFVAMNSWLTRLRTTDWDNTLWMVVYPINGDGSPVTQRYIDSLSGESFKRIKTFFADQGRHYNLGIATPLTVRLAPQVEQPPPMPDRNSGPLAVMLWSLQLRYWAFVHDTYDGPSPDIRMFVVYHDPDQHPRLQHSVGLQKGMIGVVNAFASNAMEKSNDVVIAHEFLHTVGATDKYNPVNNQPLYPDGFAEPARSPLYPQRLAEIMGGRIAVSEHQALMPKSLSSAVIGKKTAQEIRWLN
jgi:hypothetical protein